MGWLYKIHRQRAALMLVLLAAFAHSALAVVGGFHHTRMLAGDVIGWHEVCSTGEIEPAAVFEGSSDPRISEHLSSVKCLVACAAALSAPCSVSGSLPAFSVAPSTHPASGYAFPLVGVPHFQLPPARASPFSF